MASTSTSRNLLDADPPLLVVPQPMTVSSIPPPIVADSRSTGAKLDEEPNFTIIKSFAKVLEL